MIVIGVCGGTDSLKVERNVQAFLGDGVVNFPVQGNNPACVGELCNIKKVRMVDTCERVCARWFLIYG